MNFGRCIALLVIVGLMAINNLLSVCSGEEKDYFKDRERGWWWYEKILSNEVVISKEKNKKVEATPNIASKKILEDQGRNWEDALSKAILAPTEENIKNYLMLTKKINLQAQKFATAFKESIWINPEYDYTIERPTTTQAIIAKNESDFIKSEKELFEIAKTNGLIFFFRGDCPHCHRFSPILKNFSDKYKFSTIAVTLDGGNLPEFTDPQKNFYLGDKLKASIVPALYMLNPDSNIVTPISFGYADWTTLSQKVLSAAKKAERTEGGK